MKEETRMKIKTAMNKLWEERRINGFRFGWEDVSKFIGRKFGRLTVVSLLPLTGKGRIWKCTCDCGKEKEARSCSLLNGDIKSCGCLHDDSAKKSLPSGESGARHLYGNYVCSARKRKIDFKLSYKEFKNLTSKNCVYCGASPNYISKSYNAKNSHSFYHYNGIDRTDPSKGYTISNVEPCCKICNTMKWTLSRENFLKHIAKIFKFRRIDEKKNRLEG